MSDPRLDELYRKYAARLPDRVEAVADALARGRTDPHALADARALVHRLAGNAGSFGYPDVSRAMSGIERALSANPVDWPAITDVLGAARTAAARPPIIGRL